MTENDDLPDLSVHFPVDGHYWRDFESITIPDAALLSLDIEPRAILELRQQAQDDRAFDFLAGAFETEEPLLHLGQQHAEFEHRHAVISNAVSCKVLPTVGEQKKGTPKEIRLVDFVTWASAKQWPMPTWLSELGAAPPQPKARQGRENQHVRTRNQYRQWQQEAEQIKSTHPTLSEYDIAKIISRSSIGGEKSPHTIRKHIKV
ncbi:hypothetical protein [Pseudomonas sp.]|uniref:hypothetical protein n=1 Tax=Pseudomonas sp. TaxID=306 RepID=UPI0026131B67|nr:hypothetical protein [Pseudomonas sp.]